MITVEQELEKKLKQLRVHFDAPDDDTVLLRNVPTGEGYFNKARTNLLIKRPRSGMPYLICVDEDLEYTGLDSEIARAFLAGHKQQGWRVLVLGSDEGSDIQAVIEQALNAVGFDGVSPELKPALTENATAQPGKLLSSFAAEISAEASDEPTIGREECVEQVVSSLVQWQVRLPLIVGESGVGKTNLARAAARRLMALRPAIKVLAVDLGVVMSGTLFDSERENLLIALLNDVIDQPHFVVIMEHLEMALIGVPRGGLLLAQAFDRGAKLIGTTLPSYQSIFSIEPLSRRVHFTLLPEMLFHETEEVLSALRSRIADHHQIAISDAILEALVERSLSLEGHLPAKAILLADAAASRAALSNERELNLFDLHAAAASLRHEESLE